jgi:hypothetical protein
MHCKSYKAENRRGTGGSILDAEITLFVIDFHDNTDHSFLSLLMSDSSHLLYCHSSCLNCHMTVISLFSSQFEC